jgi:hypothetical protein
VLFPVIMILLIGVWVLSFTSLVRTSDELQGAMQDAGTRYKEMSDADIAVTQMPSPTDSAGITENSGMNTLTDLRLYKMSGSAIAPMSIASTLSQKMDANFSLGTVSYGDYMLFVSDQDFWGVEVMPIEQREDAVLNNIVEGSQVSMSQIFATPRKAEEPFGTVNATFKSDIEAVDDNSSTWVDRHNSQGFEWYVGSCKHSPSAQVTIWAKKSDSKSFILDLQAWNGAGYFSVYTCTFASTSFTQCLTDNLADSMKESGGLMKLKTVPSVNDGDGTYDYVLLDVICIL